jgi:pimeloyl-ACP methyl ester carboxylesterase
MRISKRVMNAGNAARQRAGVPEQVAVGPATAGHPMPAGQRSVGLVEWYDRVLAEGSVRSRWVGGAAGRVHVLEKGAGAPVLLLHGTGVAAGFFLPLLRELGVRAIAPDLPGRGLTDPIEQPRAGYRQAAVEWLDRLLDALGLDSTVVLGHSAGGLWAIWYALTHPERVTRLVLIGPPALPKTRCPLPYRLIATPGLGTMLTRLMPPTRKSALRFAGFMGEGTTLARHPDLVDLFVAAGRDPVAESAARHEVRTLVSPVGLLTPSGFRRTSRLHPDELRQLEMPTLLIWGQKEPLGSAAVAREVIELIPQAELALLPGGHAPWLGQPARTAAVVVDFIR